MAFKLIVFIGIIVAIGVFSARAYRATLKRFDEEHGQAPTRD